MISFQPAPQRDILTIYFKEYYSDEVYDQTILETSFPSKYSRELKHNSLTFIQSLHYDRLVTHKSTHSTLDIHTLIIETLTILYLSRKLSLLHTRI